jgi:hypothetical protein
MTAEYEPLDLSKWCNAGVAILGEQRIPWPGGRQTIRGLPFLIGREADDGGQSCFIALDASQGHLTIPIGLPAHQVILAHRVVRKTPSVDEGLGVHVADYVFRIAGGGEERVRIRDGFEIGAPPTTWGELQPLRAVGDQQAALMPRKEGRWDFAGVRQTEAGLGGPRWYYLWAWRNPRPENAVEALEIIPTGPQFIIAGITLGHVDEYPFPREGRRPARIVLKETEVAASPFDLDVEVDRGDATYVHPLPEAPAEAFLNNALRGWGEEQNAKSSPAYVEVSAVPSATVTVKQAGVEIARAQWGEVGKHGAVETPAARIELVDPGRNWVRITVLDEDTNAPVPCRVHFRSPQGIPFQPHGHHNHVNSNLGTWHIDVGGDLRLGQITYAYIDGTCEGWLPRGEVLVDVARGFEYEPLRTRTTIEPGQRELVLRIKRWTKMNDRRWFSGDSHVHFLSPSGAHLESQGEDLNVVNLLQSQWGSLFTNTEDFAGEPSVSRTGNNIVYVSQENRQHFMGHMILWGLKKAVMPWCSDGLDEAELGGTLETTLSHWADECHAQGGHVIQPHFPDPPGEHAALIATGRLDGVEMIMQQPRNHEYYYWYLNCGYRLPLVGGTDKMTSEVPVGLYRTYVRIPEDEEFNYDNWCRNVVQGRTFLSGGPILHFSVEGHEIGDTVSLPGPGTVDVQARAESVLPMHRLEIIQEGRVVAVAESREATRRLELKERIKIDHHTWLAARCGGSNYFDTGTTRHYDVWRRGIFAHSSPIYVACGGDWWMFDRGTAQYMLTLVEGNLAYIRESSRQYDPGAVTHRHGEDDHIAYLTRPFLEAQAAIQERMRICTEDAS